jgi:type II restriction enzyme
MPTAKELSSLISNLSKKPHYRYVNKANAGRIKLEGVEGDGSIRFRRYNQSKDETLEDATEETIPSSMIARVAAEIEAGKPFNIDKIVGASYNSRSVLESLLAHTPNYFVIYPGRVETSNGMVKVKKGHKHLLWDPHSSHPTGTIKIKTDPSPRTE